MISIVVQTKNGSRTKLPLGFATIEEAREAGKKVDPKFAVWIEKELSGVETVLKNVPLNTVERYAI